MSVYAMAVCSDRHYIPDAVDGAVFPKNVENIHDYHTLFNIADKNIPQSCHLLKLYITGLTPCTLAIVSVCQAREIPMICYHYDKVTGRYFGQVMQ